MKDNAEKQEFVELALRLRKSDEAALSELLRRLDSSVAATLKSHFTGQLSNEDIEDILAVTLWKIWQKRETLESAGGNLRALFYLTARNTAIDVLRKKRREIPRIPLEDVLASLYYEPDVSQQAQTLDEFQVEIQNIIKSLPERERRVAETDLLSRSPEEWSNELAEELGITRENLRKIRSRLRRKIRDALVSKKLLANL